MKRPMAILIAVVATVSMGTPAAHGARDPSTSGPTMPIPGPRVHTAHTAAPAGSSLVPVQPNGCTFQSTRCVAWTSPSQNAPGADAAGDGGLGNSEIIDTSPDGSTVFVVASSSGGRVTTQAVDTADGSIRWTKVWEEPVTFSTAFALEVAPNGRRVFVAAYWYDPDEEKCLNGVSALAADDGRTLWRARGDSCWAPVDLVADPRRPRLYVVGGLRTSKKIGAKVVALDTRSGDRAWRRRSQLGLYTVSSAEHMSRAAVSDDGRSLYVVGSVVKPWPESPESYDAYDLVVWRYDLEGGPTLAWKKRVVLGASNPAAGVALSDTGGRIFVTNTLRGNRFETGVYAFSRKGEVLWERRVPNSQPWGQGPIATDGGRVYVAFKSWDVDPDGDMRYEVRAWASSDGVPRWEHRYRSAHQDEAALTRFSEFVTFPALDVSADGSKVFVMGSGNFAIEAFAVSSGTGERQWASAYNPEELSSAAGIVASPNRDQFYLGGFVYTEDESFSDLVVVAYDG